MSNCVASIVVIATILALIGPAQPQQLSQAWSWCRNPKQPSDVSIKGCTIIIQSRRETAANRAVAHNNRANAWVDKQDDNRAIADYNDSIRLNPSYAVAYANRALVWLRKKEYDRALADFDEAILLDPANPSPYSDRGLTYFRKGDYNRAIVDYNEAIRRRPTYAVAYSNRASAWLRKEDYDQAVADYGHAIRLDPGSGHAFSGRAEAFFMKRDYVRSMNDYETAIKLDSKNPARWSSRCFARAAMGQLQEALADCNQALQLKPDYANALANRGFVYRSLGQFDEAIAQYDLALRLDPTLSGSLYGRGLAKIKQGDSKNGEADIAAALALRPDIVEDWRRWGIPAVVAETPATKIPVAAAAAPVPAILPLERRIALVIGNSAYTKAPALPNPRRDAETIASALRRVGFQTVTLESDLTKDRFTEVLRRFASEAEQADWALVYFAGHGIEMDGVNYLIPVDASLASDRDVTFEAVPLGQILTAVDGAKKLRLVVLDACRNNPFLNQMRRTVASRSIGQGLGRVEPEAGTLVVYAAKHGEVALDGDQRNSPFVAALTTRILTPGIEVRRLFDMVRDDVIAATNRKQQPFSYGSVSGSEDFYFVAR